MIPIRRWLRPLQRAILAAIKEVYSVQTFREAVPEFECRESIIAQNSCCSLVSLAEIEYENRESRRNYRESRRTHQELRHSHRESSLDSRFMQGSRVECQLTFERYCKNNIKDSI